MLNDINQELIHFIDHNPTCFHVVRDVRSLLKENGFEELYEKDEWTLKPEGKYFVIRNESSAIAFKIPANPVTGYRIAASHSDSPLFKIKENPEIESEGVIKLNVENYGSPVDAPWFDRPLSIAGRVLIQAEHGIETKIINIDRDLCMIPSLAIHMDRTANTNRSINVQEDMCPVLCGADHSGAFMELIANEVHTKPEYILAHDLYVYPRVKGTLWGMNNEFLSAMHLDDLQCGFANIHAFLEAEMKDAIAVFAIFDNEEVGSLTKQGANGTFLDVTLRRLTGALHFSNDDYYRLLPSSFMVSADNAHAAHPNYPSKADPVNRPRINEGIVLKYSANQKYVTDGVSAAIFKSLCNKNNIPYQVFTNRSDMTGGTTLGNLSNAHVSLNTVDIGLPQWAMHSPYETAGTKDTESLMRFMKIFFETKLTDQGNGNYTLQ